MDHGPLGAGDPLEQAVLLVVVHQEADRAAVHAVDRLARRSMACAGLQHEAVAAQGDDHLGLLGFGRAVAGRSAAPGRPGPRAGRGRRRPAACLEWASSLTGPRKPRRPAKSNGGFEFVMTAAISARKARAAEVEDKAAAEARPPRPGRPAGTGSACADSVSRVGKTRGRCRPPRRRSRAASGVEAVRASADVGGGEAAQGGQAVDEQAQALLADGADQDSPPAAGRRTAACRSAAVPSRRGRVVAARLRPWRACRMTPSTAS